MRSIALLMLAAYAQVRAAKQTMPLDPEQMIADGWEQDDTGAWTKTTTEVSS